jgi:hypothetical protein
MAVTTYSVEGNVAISPILHANALSQMLTYTSMLRFGLGHLRATSTQNGRIAVLDAKRPKGEGHGWPESAYQRSPSVSMGASSYYVVFAR